MPGRPLLCGFAREFVRNPLALVWLQPASLLGPVRQINERQYPTKKRGNSLQNQKPAPSRQTSPMQAQQQTRNRSSDRVRDRNCRHEHRNRFGAVLLPEPVRQVYDDSREEAAFGEAKQKTE